jgi:hypothetical protein
LVTLAISISHTPDEVQAVTGVYLCYAYGLYQFQESRQRMDVRQQPALPGTLESDITVDYEASVTLPSEPGCFSIGSRSRAGRTEPTIRVTCMAMAAAGSATIIHTISPVTPIIPALSRSQFTIRISPFHPG